VTKVEPSGTAAIFDIAVVVGNPKPASRTLTVASAVAERLARELAVDDRATYHTHDLVELSAGLFDWSSEDVATAVQQVSNAHLLVVASPTYKATYTGLLKAFLDWFDDRALEGVIVVPVMVGAGERHALAVEVHLRPTLVELGGVIPTRGLYVLEHELDDLEAVLDRWLTRARVPMIAAVEGDLRGRRREHE
jgi:FMN reductase